MANIEWDLLQLVIQKCQQALSDYAKTVPVFVSVPEETNFPYILIEPPETYDDEMLALKKYRHIVRLSVWSAQEGAKEVLEIMGLIRPYLHRINRTELTNDYYLWQSKVTFQQASQDLDGKTFMGNMYIEFFSAIHS
jgi:hypothetical protein